MSALNQPTTPPAVPLVRRSRTRTSRSRVPTTTSDRSPPGEQSLLPYYQDDIAGTVKLPSSESELSHGGLHSEPHQASEPYVRKWRRSMGESSAPAMGAESRRRQNISEDGDHTRIKRKVTRRGSSLPRRALRLETSIDSLQPVLPQIHRRGKHRPYNHKSEQSRTSSSLYPHTVSTISGTESPPSPRSLMSDDQNNQFRVFMSDSEVNPHQDELQLLDADDVSYRLRLLVKNNYYLPPAHAKPTSMALHGSVQQTAKRSPAPAFLDLFRVGKSRSKPTTPFGPLTPESAGPILRTTSDSTNTPFFQSTNQSIPATPHNAAQPPCERRGRVVVVRETMDDIAVAAKQAELVMREHPDGRRRSKSRNSRRGRDAGFDVVIDPTDVVDLPPPSSNYPFPVQASALQGLGVEQSVGAAVLADRLPPTPTSPWSVDSEETAWRKALLKEAVSFSLNNSPAVTPAPVSASTTPTPSLHLQATRSRSMTVSDTLCVPASTHVRMKRNLGQQIIPPDVVEQHAEQLEQREVVLDGERRSLGEKNKARKRSSSVPRLRKLPLLEPANFPRSQTPVTPTFALSPPPPRRRLLNPLFSLSQNYLPDSQTKKNEFDEATLDRSRSIRRSMSTPFLSNMYEMDVGIAKHLDIVLPSSGHARPETSSAPSVVVNADMSNSGRRSTFSVRSVSQYSQDDHDEGAFHTPADSDISGPRPSLSASLPGHSASDISYRTASPTASAFQDALGAEFHSLSHSSAPRKSIDSRTSHVSSTFFNPALHNQNLPPLPRISMSSTASRVLPPPRTSSIIAQSFGRPSISSNRPSVASRPSIYSQLSYSGPDPFANHDAPSTPILPSTETGSDGHPFHIAERRGHPVPHSLAVRDNAVKSIPPPASPIEFFDQIQTEPNAIDDLNSSDDEDGSVSEESAVVFIDPVTHAISNTAAGARSTPSLMRLGNHSTPYLTPSTHSHESGQSPFGALEPMNPLHVPLSAARSHFLPLKKSGKGPNFAVPVLPDATLEFMKDMRGRSSTASGHTSRRSKSSQRPATTGSKVRREEDERLDGILVQHMEAERDALKRILSKA